MVEQVHKHHKSPFLMSGCKVAASRKIMARKHITCSFVSLILQFVLAVLVGVHGLHKENNKYHDAFFEVSDSFVGAG